MVIMENYCTPQDRLREIWLEIDRCHLSYLEMEESPEKIQQRNKLEDYIREYLCMAQHCEKFMFVETAEILQASASRKSDFSGYKAATGFNAIQLYAGNLLAQPWRKEYRQIKTYCGFYKHQIEANLTGAEMMFEAMGYRHDGNGILLLEGPVCPDVVTTISRDCLIAYVECQILKAIWEEVTAQFIEITWQEVLEFRKTHLCGPEQSVKALKYKQHQKKYQYQEHTRSYSQGSDPYSNRHQLINQVPIAQNLPPLIPHTNLPHQHHHMVGLPPPLPPTAEYMYASSGCWSNNYSPSYYMPCQQNLLKHSVNVNGYCYNGMVPPQLPGYHYAVPTAQLIELEATHNGSSSQDVVDRAGGHSHSVGHRSKPPPTLPPIINNDLHKNRNNNLVVAIGDKDATSLEKNSSKLEDWDYVYRNLESQGYSKDLGERGDILSPGSSRLQLQHQQNVIRKVKATNLDDAMNSLILNSNSKPQKMTESLKKVERERSRPAEIVKVDKQTSPSSSYENLTIPQELKKPSPPKMNVLSNNSSIVKTTINNNSFLHGRSLDLQKPKDETKPSSFKSNNVDAVVQSEKWHCQACTFLNESSKDICVMCSKSRLPVMEKPIEIGGSECRNCTLVNPKNEKICQACSKSLEDSATYI